MQIYVAIFAFSPLLCYSTYFCFLRNLQWWVEVVERDEAEGSAVGKRGEAV